MSNGALARDEINRIRKYAEHLDKQSSGRAVEPVVPGVTDDTGRSPNHDDLKQQVHDYRGFLYELLSRRRSEAIWHTIETKLPGKIPYLQRLHDGALRDIKREGSIVVTKGQVQPDFSTCVGIKNFCDELRNAASQLQSQRGQGQEQGETAPEKLHVDLREWNDCGSRKLLHDLLSDSRRLGISISSKRHGKNQPKELRRRLREKHLERLAKAIVRVQGKRRTYKVDIARDQIEFKPPTT